MRHILTTFGLALAMCGSIAAIVAGGSILLRFAGEWLRWPWLANADRETLKFLSAVFLLVPAAILVIPRITTKASRAAEAERQRRLAELRDDQGMTLRWSVPIRTELAHLPVYIFITAGLYLLTFVAVVAVLGTLNLITYFRHLPITEPTVATAFKCANLIGMLMLALPVVFVAILRVRTKVLLGPEGLIERLGGLRKIYDYHDITRCRIEPSPRVKALRCLAFSVARTDGSPRWHRFEFASDAPVDQIVAFLNAQGLAIEVENAG